MKLDEATMTLIVTLLKIKDGFQKEIYGESHKVKSVKTWSHRALAELEFDIRLLITASAMLNKPG